MSAIRLRQRVGASRSSISMAGASTRCWLPKWGDAFCGGNRTGLFAASLIERTVAIRDSRLQIAAPPDRSAVVGPGSTIYIDHHERPPQEAEADWFPVALADYVVYRADPDVRCESSRVGERERSS